MKRRSCPNCGRSSSETNGKTGNWTRTCNCCGRTVRAATKKELEDRFYDVTFNTKKIGSVEFIDGSQNVKSGATVNKTTVIINNDPKPALVDAKSTTAESSIRQYIKLGAKLVEESPFCFTIGAKRPLFKSQVWFDLRALADLHDIIIKVDGRQYMSNADGMWQQQSGWSMTAGPKVRPENLLNFIKKVSRAGVYGMSDSVYDDALLVECIACSCQDWRFCIGRPGQKDFKK